VFQGGDRFEQRDHLRLTEDIRQLLGELGIGNPGHDFRPIQGHVVEEFDSSQVDGHRVSCEPLASMKEVLPNLLLTQLVGRDHEVSYKSPGGGQIVRPRRFAVVAKLQVGEHALSGGTHFSSCGLGALALRAPVRPQEGIPIL
jgi:hypothetical protein